MNDAQSMQFRYELERNGFALDVAAEIPLQGVTGIFGASGAGKTTLLRCIAGLEQARVGELVVAGERWQGDGAARPVHEREIGYVFQEPRLFSHLSVKANIEYGMRRSSNNGPRLDDVVGMLGLDAFLDRWPDELSPIFRTI